MTYVRSLVALSIVVGAGALYDASLGAALTSASTTAAPQPALVALPGPVAVTPEPADARPVVITAEPPRQEPVVKKVDSSSVSVPFYSQFSDISAAEWRKIGCGITSLAMIVDYYKPAVSVDTLLAQGIAAGAYLTDAGWTYKGLIEVGQAYGLVGSSHDLAPLGQAAAFDEFLEYVKGGPVIASVHYQFDPASTIPHLVVINQIAGEVVYYNDPAAAGGGGQISTTDFLKAWKKRFIVIRPA